MAEALAPEPTALGPRGCSTTHPLELLHDLQGLRLVTNQALILVIALGQAMRALRDEAFGALPKNVSTMLGERVNGC